LEPNASIPEHKKKKGEERKKKINKTLTVISRARE